MHVSYVSIMDWLMWSASLQHEMEVCSVPPRLLLLPGCQVTIDQHLPLYKDSSRTVSPYLWLACKIMSYILCSFYLFVFMKNDYSPTVWNNEYSSDREIWICATISKVINYIRIFLLKWMILHKLLGFALLCFLPMHLFKVYLMVPGWGVPPGPWNKPQAWLDALLIKC